MRFWRHVLYLQFLLLLDGILGEGSRMSVTYTSAWYKFSSWPNGCMLYIFLSKDLQFCQKNMLVAYYKLGFYTILTSLCHHKIDKESINVQICLYIFSGKQHLKSIKCNLSGKLNITLPIAWGWLVNLS